VNSAGLYRYRIDCENGKRLFTWKRSTYDARKVAEKRGYKVKQIVSAPNPLLDR